MKVTSSNIESIEFEDGNLIVEYKAGTKYQYSKVPENIWEDFKVSESKGKFMNQYIKGNYEYKKL